MAEKSEQAAQASTIAHERGTVENKTPKPAGLLPKNTQQLVILGVATVMILIMWLGGGAKAKRSSKPASADPQVESASPATVAAFKQAIEQQEPTGNQPISQANWKRLQALGLAGDMPPGGAVVPPPGASAPEAGGIIGAAAGQSSAPPDPIEQDMKKRAYLSLFAPNVAFTYRKSLQARLASDQAVSQGADGQQLKSNSPANVAGLPVSPAAAAGETAHSPYSPEQSQPSGVRAGQTDQGSPAPRRLNSFTGKTYVLFEGTIIETVLMNRLDGSFSGPANCLVTTDIYSHDHQHVLIPAGTKVLGEAKKVDAFGQKRLAVFFHRLIMPDGYSVSLDQFKGLSQTGETALRDKVNNHYLQIFGSSLAVGILGGVAEAGTGNVLTNSAFDQARAGFGASLANSSMNILDRFLNIPPTITIREGCRVNVYLAGDLVLPDYANHTMSPDL